MKNRKMKYRVHYGNCISYMDFSSWSDLTQFMKMCIEDGTRVKGVSKL